MWPTVRNGVDAARSAALLIFFLLWRPALRTAAVLLVVIGFAHLTYSLAIDSVPDEYFWFTLSGSSFREALGYISSYRYADALRLVSWLLLACLSVYWLWSRDTVLRGYWRWLGWIGLLIWLVWIINSIKNNGVDPIKFLTLSKVERVYPSMFIRSYLRYRKSSKNIFVIPSIKKPVHPPMADVVVLVIGESASAQRWSLFGYQGNPTNAALSHWQDGIVALPVQTNGNNTALTAPILLAGQPLGLTGGVLTYLDKAAKAGFKVVTLSNQIRFDFDIRDSFTFTVFSQRSTEFHQLQPGAQWDEALTPLFMRALDGTPAPAKLMLTVHTYGSHPVVKDRYPSAAAQWPDAYDNSISYTSRLLADWIARLDRVNDRRVVLIYISDHGLAFPACGGSYAHGYTRSAYEVPLMIWSNALFRTNNAAWWLQWQARATNAIAEDGSLRFTNLLEPFAIDDLLGMTQASRLPSAPIETTTLPPQLYPPPADDHQCDPFTPYDVAKSMK
jgi:glucan phosphoethanolaminetransferase (alkaline phosphatase superfamily)